MKTFRALILSLAVVPLAFACKADRYGANADAGTIDNSATGAYAPATTPGTIGERRLETAPSNTEAPPPGSEAWEQAQRSGTELDPMAENRPEDTTRTTPGQMNEEQMADETTEQSPRAGETAPPPTDQTTEQSAPMGGMDGGAMSKDGGK